MISHLLQVGRLPRVDESHHFFKDIGLDVGNVDSVLEKLWLKEVVPLPQARARYPNFSGFFRLFLPS